LNHHAPNYGFLRSIDPQKQKQKTETKTKKKRKKWEERKSEPQKDGPGKITWKRIYSLGGQNNSAMHIKMLEIQANTASTLTQPAFPPGFIVFA